MMPHSIQVFFKPTDGCESLAKCQLGSGPIGPRPGYRPPCLDSIYQETEEKMSEGYTY